MCKPQSGVSAEADIAVLTQARAQIEPLLTDPRCFANKCEDVFGDIRRASVHLRKDRDSLDAVDAETKTVIATFLVKVCETRSALSGRCDEVGSILFGSTWKKQCMKSDIDGGQAKIEPQNAYGDGGRASAVESEEPEHSNSGHAPAMEERLSLVDRRLAKGKKIRGVAPDAPYKFGDFTRGLWSKVSGGG